MVLHGFKNVIGQVPEIDFGTLLYQETQGPDCTVISLKDVAAADAESYMAALEAMGYAKESTHSFGTDNVFVLYTMGEAAIYLSFYPGAGELRLVGERNSAYLTFKDQAGDERTTSLLTQIDLEDFGCSYVIRLRDGRFIIFDGGCEFEPDADKLLAVLKEQSPDEKPMIAGWILTHAHVDHYRCFLVFWEKYREEVEIQYFLYNFPGNEEVDFAKNIPDLAGEIPYLERMERYIAESGVPVIRPHTGQIYQFGNARLETICCLDDTCCYPCEGNNLSVVFKMFIEGQSILWCADNYMEDSRLAQRYGKYLKSDMLQIAHHGFCGGSIRCHKIIDPMVCLAPVHEDDFYRIFDVYFEFNRTLIYDLNVQEILTGGHGHVIMELPYKPAPNGKFLLLERARELSRQMGAKSWFFGDMTWEDCKFTFLNPSVAEPEVYATLYFEDRADKISNIKIDLPQFTVRTVDFTTGEYIDGDALYFNRNSLARKGAPVGKTFALHILSDTPIVIWGNKKPVYAY